MQSTRAGLATALTFVVMTVLATTSVAQDEGTPTLRPGGSRSVRTDILPGVALEVNEVAAGAYRVLGDGVRDLSNPRAHWVVSGRDGSVWLGSMDEPRGAFRIGRPGSLERPIAWATLHIAPDGTLWTIEHAPRSGKRVVRSFDGEVWTRHQLPRPLRTSAGPSDIDVGADGTVWVVGGSRVGRLDPTGWHLLKGKVPTQGFVVTDGGEPWSPFYLRRFSDGAWRPMSNSNDQGYVGRGGTAWIEGGRNERGMIENLERLDDDGLRTACPLDEQPYGFVPLIDGISVAADGSLWGVYGITPNVAGLARFDCTSWQYPLPDVAVGSGVGLAFADDGSVWVLATLPNEQDTAQPSVALADGRHRELYVITPDAYAGSEVRPAAPGHS